jgi:hypothetical protein
MTCKIGHFNWQKKMRIFVRVTAVKADEGTRLEYKVLRSQLDNFIFKCIVYIFLKKKDYFLIGVTA